LFLEAKEQKSFGFSKKKKKKKAEKEQRNFQKSRKRT